MKTSRKSKSKISKSKLVQEGIKILECNIYELVDKIKALEMRVAELEKRTAMDYREYPLLPQCPEPQYPIWVIPTNPSTGYPLPRTYC